MSIETIEQIAKEHAADRTLLTERVHALHEEMEAAKRRRLPGIKTAVCNAQDSRLRLRAALEEHRALFERPKTRVLHGIKVGFQKAKGKLLFDLEVEQVLKLIRRHLPDQVQTLIKSTEKPVKPSLLQLPAADLKRIGCSVVGTGDQVVIAPVDSEIDELVDVLLGTGEDADVEDAA